MMLSIQPSTQSNNKSNFSGVIPPISSKNNTISDSVSFSGAEKIEPVLQKEFVKIHKRLIRFFNRNSDINEIKKSFDSGHKIRISRQYLAKNDSIVVDAVQVSPTGIRGVEHLVKNPVSVSGVRYVIKDSGKVRRQVIEGHADAGLKTIYAGVAPKPYLADEYEALDVIDAMDSMLRQKQDELNELCRLGKRPVIMPAKSTPTIVDWDKVEKKNKPQISTENQQKKQEETTEQKKTMKGLRNAVVSFFFGK